MKHSIKTISAALLMLATAACQREESAMSGYADDPNAVKLNVSIAGAIESRANTTGAGDAWSSGDKIYVANTSTDAIEHKKSAVYNYTTAWALDGTDYMVWVDGTNTFQAFYPYVEGSENSYSNFELPADQSTAEKIAAADWMTATKSTAKTADRTLDLEFKHEFTKVVIRIKGYNDQYNGASVTVTDPVLTLSKYRPALTGFVTTTSTTVTPLTTASATDGKHSYTAIVTPGTYDANTNFFTLKVDGVELPVLTNAFLVSPGMLSGKSYTFDLVVGKETLLVNDVTVEDWTSGAVLEEGEETNTEEMAFIDAEFISALSWKHSIPVTNGMIDPTDPTTKQKLEAITSLDISSKNIYSLKGIEYFTNLENLRCESTKIAKLDVSRNTKLKTIICNSCHYLSNLIVDNPELKSIEAMTTALVKLDLRKCPKLEALNCNYCDDLQELDMSGNSELKELHCYYTLIAELDFSNNKKLEELLCGGSRLKSLILDDCEALVELSCESNNLTELNLPKSTKLNTLIFNKNKVTTLNLAEDIPLTYLNCSQNLLTTLDLGKYPTIKTFICDENPSLQLTNLDKLTAMTYFSCSDNGLTTLDVSKNTNLETVFCRDNELSTLDVRSCTKLTGIYCSGNNLTSLDLSKNEALRSCECQANSISSLDISALKNLTSLQCGENLLDALTVTDANANLTTLVCGSQKEDKTITVTIPRTIYDNLSSNSDVNQTGKKITLNIVEPGA